MPTPFHQTTRALDAGGRRWLIAGALVGALALGGWGAWFAEARVAVFVPGALARVELDRPSLPIEVEVGGRLVESRLALDRPVAAGEVLVRLDDGPLRLSLAEAEAALTGLRARRVTRIRERAARAAALEPAAAADAAGIAEARARLDAARAAHRLARAEADRAAELAARAVASSAEVERLRAAERRARAEAREQAEQVSRLRAERTRSAAERDAALAGMDAEQATLDAEIEQAEARLARLRGDLEATTVRAPAAGRIAAVDPRGVGAVLAPGARLGTIVGPGDLRIVARVPAARALGRVRVGQRARLRVDGFPWTRYGVVEATVTGVAAEASDGWLRVELAPGEAHDVPLQHGLTGQLEIEVEQIAPLEMLLAALGRAVQPEAAAVDAGDGGGR